MDQEIYIAFDRYLSLEMSEKEKSEFEQLLLANAEMRAEFEIYKETTGFLSHRFSVETVAFKKQLKAASEVHLKVKPKSKLLRLNPWITGLAASLVLFVATWMFLQNQKPEYSDYSQHEMAMFVERGDENNDLRAAQDFFNAKKYAKAAGAFSKLNLANSTELQYFYAISLVETSEFSKSDVLLNAIIAGKSAYKYKAAWYLALSKLKQENFEDCKTILKQIPPRAEDYKKAQELLDDLD